MVRHATILIAVSMATLILPFACNEPVRTDRPAIGDTASTSSPFVAASIPATTPAVFVPGGDECKVIGKMQAEARIEHLDFMPSLGSLIGKIAQKHRVKISVDWDSLATIGAGKDYQVGDLWRFWRMSKGVSLQIFLEKLCQSISDNLQLTVPVEYYIKGDTIYIAQSDCIPRAGVISMTQAWQLACSAQMLTDRQRKVVEQMRVVLKDFNCRGNGFDDAIQPISTASGVVIDIDTPSLVAAGIGGYVAFDSRLKDISAIFGLGLIVQVVNSTNADRKHVDAYIQGDAIIITADESILEEQGVISILQADYLARTGVTFKRERKAIPRMLNSMKGLTVSDKYSPAVSIGDIAAHIQQFGLQVYLDCNGLQDAGIELDECDEKIPFENPDISVVDCLDNFVSHFDSRCRPGLPVVWYLKGNVITITNIQAMKRTPDIVPMADVRKMLADASVLTDGQKQIMERLEAIVKRAIFQDISLTDVVDYFRESTEINIFVDWGSLYSVGISQDSKCTLWLDSASALVCLDKSLEYVSSTCCSPVPIKCYLKDNVLVVATDEAMARVEGACAFDVLQLWTMSDLCEKQEEELREKMRTIKLRASPSGSVEDLVNYLRIEFDLNIFVNWRALESARISKDSNVVIRPPGADTFQTYLDKLMESMTNMGCGRRVIYHIDGNVLTITCDESSPVEKEK